MRLRRTLVAATALAAGGIAMALPGGGASADEYIGSVVIGDCNYDTYFDAAEGHFHVYETCTRIYV